MPPVKLKPYILVFLFFCILPVSSAFAVQPIMLTDTLEELCIAREYVEYLEDPGGKMTIDDILKLGNSSNQFIPSTSQDLINQNIKSAYWLRFEIEDKSRFFKPFRIELFDFNIDEISFYYADTNGVYKEHKAGFGLPFSFREINHKNVSFRMPSHLQGRHVMYMRFHSNKRNVLEPMVRSYDQTINYALNEYILFGIFYGLLLLVILYNLIYFISLRKAYYIYYVLYGCGVFIYLLSMNGIGFQFLWSNIPWINKYTGETGLTIATLSMLLFINSFLELRTNAKKLYLLLAIGFLVRIFIYGFQLSFPHFYLFEIFDLVYFQAIFLMILKLHRTNVPSTKLLMIAYWFPNFSLLITLLEQVSMIHSTILTVYSVNLGIILQMVFLSIAIAEKIKEVYKEKNKAQEELIAQYHQNKILKEKVNRELEEKVRERTLELKKANQELNKRAEESHKMSIALDLANYELKKYINAFAISTVTKTYLDFEDFKKAYPDELACTLYLRDLKEQKGFVCIKCGNDKSIKGKAKFDMRCSKCNYNESLTANTIFHRIKFPLQKAFYMLYLVVQKNGEISAVDLAGKLELQKMTCQNFKNKILSRQKILRKNNKSKEITWEYLIMDAKKLQEVS